MSAVDMHEDPQMNLLLQQSSVYQIYCKEREYHLDRNIEEESQWKIFEGFYDLGWEILGRPCKEENWLVLGNVYNVVALV